RRRADHPARRDPRAVHRRAGRAPAGPHRHRAGRARPGGAAGRGRSGGVLRPAAHRGRPGHAGRRHRRPDPAPELTGMFQRVPSQLSGSTGRTRSVGRPTKVLVVDDEPSISALLTATLRLVDFQVCAAADGAGALKAAAEFQPDLVVLDVMLPDLDGFEVARRLRAEGRAVPVLFLTARDAVEDRISGLTVGGDDYVTKP